MVDKSSRTIDVATLENASGSCPALIICEHASNYIPPDLSNLGLTADALRSHIAWDPGALGVARELARRMDAPLIHASVSRLVIDLNREPTAPDSIVMVGETTPVPGNAALNDTTRRHRIRTVYEPFHRFVGEFLDKGTTDNSVKAVISIHSFTPVLHGKQRPWHLGFIHDTDDRLARHAFGVLSADSTLKIGLNEPYNPAHGVFHTLERHACARALAPLMVEIRNDFIGEQHTQNAMAARLAPVFSSAISAL